MEKKFPLSNTECTSEVATFDLRGSKVARFFVPRSLELEGSSSQNREAHFLAMDYVTFPHTTLPDKESGNKATLIRFMFGLDPVPFHGKGRRRVASERSRPTFQAFPRFLPLVSMPNLTLSLSTINIAHIFHLSNKYPPKTTNLSAVENITTRFFFCRAIYVLSG